MIYHLSTPEEWQQAQESGDYRSSSRDQSLDQVGFIHCSYLDQVPGVLERYYVGAGPLLLLAVDPALLTAPCKDDEIAPGVFFPHVYGPINLEAVVEVIPVAAAPDGSHAVPAP
jgi:uncharacterized protein (DUF952 family)